MESPIPRRLLAILTHPDEEWFAVGGTLAKYAHLGIRTVLLCVTRGEPESVDDVCEQELRTAAGLLGTEVYFLGYADGSLSGEDPEKLLEDIACWIDTVQPQAILTFGPEGISGHPDHVTLSRVVTQAVEQYFPNVCLLYMAPSETTGLDREASSPGEKKNPSLISVDITDYKMEKIQAIHSLAGQRRLLSGKPEEEVEKTPCHEVFTVAHTRKPSRDLIDCFKP